MFYLDSFTGNTMRYLGLALITTALAGCSAAGLGGSQGNSCVPYCNSYFTPSYAAQSYSQMPYNQAYSQAYNHQTGYQTVQAGFVPQQTAYAPQQVTYASQPSPHAYGTHAYAHVPQLRGSSNPYAARGYKYGNLGAILYDFDSGKIGLQGRVGYQSAGIFGGELEGSISLGSDTEALDADTTAIVRGFTDPLQTPSASTLTTEFTNSIAAFALARLPISDNFSIHSRAGLHATRFKSELDDGTLALRQNETSVDIAYGIGANYSFTPRNDIRLDYTVYQNDLGGNADSLSVAVAHKF